MFGLITMLLSTLGATGMGSTLKIIAGIFDRIGAAKESREKREILREMDLRKADVEFQKAVFGEANADNSAFTRGTRRLIALIGMLNFFVISVLCTIWPGVELLTFTPPENKDYFSFLFGLIKIPMGSETVVAITTGHIALISITMLGAIIGFYFTPGGRK
jgi:hypothetical protein